MSSRAAPSDLRAGVETVRGPVAAELLGRTLAHEHIFVFLNPVMKGWDEEAELAHAIVMLRGLATAGFETLIDPTPWGTGRNVARIARLNDQVDLNIVVCTGVYAFRTLPPPLEGWSAEALTELFVRELREGIEDTSIKAAFLKCVVEADGLVDDVPTVLAAVAAASVETGAPVMVHTNSAAKTGLLALDTLSSAGVPPERIVIAHAGDSNDLDYFKRIAESGAYLGCDRFGVEQFNPDEQRIATTAALVAEGYGNRLHLSHDTACYIDIAVGNPAFADFKQDYLHLSTMILPLLLEAGVSEDDVERMLVENPRHWLTGQSPGRSTAHSLSSSVSSSSRPSTGGGGVAAA